VEVITVPSAKYDGEGSAGIINLITRKKQVNGVAGSVNTTIGTRHNSVSLNLNVAKGRFGLTGGGHAVWSPPRDAVFDFDREDILEGGEVRTLMQDGTNSSERLGFRGKFGAYYDFNAFNSINSNVSFHGANFNKIGDFTSSLIDPISEDEISKRNNDAETRRNSIDWNTDYTRKFPDSEREFSLGFQLNRSIDNKDIKLLQTGNLESLNIDELSDNESNNLETTLQVDYVHPFSKSTKLEVGAKGILRSIDSDFFFEEFDFDQNKYVRDAGRSDQFAYQQDVYAGYASLNTKFGEKYSMIAGVRYEGTAIDGQFAVEDNKGFKNDYSNILPTVILSRKMSQMSNLRISYTQRIQRPSLRFINPYVDQQDRNNISFGNPELQPELSHNFELGYNNYIKGVVINTALYYRHTTEVIQSLLSIDGAGRSATTFQNVGEDNTLGLNFFTSTTIKKILSLRANFDFRHKDLSGELRGSKISNSGIEYNGNAGATLKLPKEISLQFWGMFRSARVTLQGTRTTFRMYSLSMAKKIWGKRGSIGIKATNLFHDKLHFDTILEGENFKQSSLYAYPFRSIGINFNYRFGKLDFKGGERKNKVKNTDQKEGEGGEF
ncbi:MAG TPA: TonB-dependent receptor, partial [Bacteroidetes bacterium]|nr:TonB-dependent receptor [Bacteroidota bacterium]